MSKEDAKRQFRQVVNTNDYSNLRTLFAVYRDMPWFPEVASYALGYAVRNVFPKMAYLLQKYSMNLMLAK